MTEWKAFYGLEPFGEARADLRAGIIASTVRNSAMGKKGKRSTPKDFMPLFEEKAGLKPKQSIKDLKAALMGLVKRTK